MTGLQNPAPTASLLPPSALHTPMFRGLAQGPWFLSLCGSTFQGVAVGWNPWTAIAEQEELDLMFLPAPVPGLYDPARQVIVVATGQTATMRRSVAAEELAHHVLGHRPCPCHIETARMELQARRWAARKLLSIKHLAGAMVCAHCWDDIADDLEVDLILVKERIGDLTDSEMTELLHLIRTFEIMI